PVELRKVNLRTAFHESLSIVQFVKNNSNHPSIVRGVDDGREAAWESLILGDGTESQEHQNDPPKRQTNQERKDQHNHRAKTHRYPMPVEENYQRHHTPGNYPGIS